LTAVTDIRGFRLREQEELGDDVLSVYDRIR
jgi:hypothetical protein